MKKMPHPPLPPPTSAALSAPIALPPVIILLLLLAVMLPGCTSTITPPRNNVVDLTLWHPYGQQMGTSIGLLIDEFNDTVGAEKGVHVKTTYIATATELHEKLFAAVSDDPGSPEIPDLAVIYPRVAVTLAEMGLLMDFATQFSADELARYVPAFLEEGKLGGDTLYILPVAKSTEVLYVNSTAFDRFAKDTGVTLGQLGTVEGILDAAEKYHDWSGGKAFIHIVELFNFAMSGFDQLGESFIDGESLNLSSPTFQRIWDAYYTRAVKGGVAVFDNYGNYLMAAGEIICALGTSASVTFYPESVTYADNTKEDCEMAILPYPVFAGGDQTVLQRGAGVSVFASDSQKEYAAGVFLKWLTEPEQNLRFTVQTGYMPVTQSAFSDFMAEELTAAANVNVQKLFGTVTAMQKAYRFYYPPVFDGLEERQRHFHQSLLKTAEQSKSEYLILLETHDPDEAFAMVSQGALARFIAEQ